MANVMPEIKLNCAVRQPTRNGYYDNKYLSTIAYFVFRTFDSVIKLYLDQSNKLNIPKCLDNLD